MEMKISGADVRTAAACGGETSVEHQIAGVRRFMRFFIKRTGLLRRRSLSTTVSSTKARILGEIASREGCTAKGLAEELQLDNSSLSRLLRSLGEKGIVRRERSPSDGRTNHLFLTEVGKMVCEPIGERARRQAEALLLPLSETERVQLIHAMQIIESLLQKS
jgi:DNA-binding MarR family transcriptional regulator